MADAKKPAKDEKDGGKKPSLIMGLVVPLVLVTAVGMGGGYAGYSFFGGDGAPAKKPDGAAPEAAAAGEHGAKAEKGAKSEHKAEGKKDAKDGHGEATPEEQAAAEADAEANPPMEDEPPADMAEIETHDFPPVVTNIADPSTVWVRLEGQLKIKKGGEKKPEAVAASASQQMLAYLRTVKLADLQGSAGLYALVEDLDDVVRAASGGQAQGVMITGLIVE